MSEQPENGITLPAPTAWPMVLASGITLLGAGYLMHPMLAVVGVAAVLLGCAGWFREVLPVEREEIVPVLEQAQVAPSSRAVLPFRVGANGHRMRLPLEVYPYSVGLKAGLAGGAAMAIVGCLFGVLTHGSIWYPINLMAAAGSATLTEASTAELARFSPGGLILASVAHLSLSVLVGVLYAALLPMFSRRPILTAGLIIPVLMSGITWALLRAVNPLLNQRIEWTWFIASQVAFGAVAGWVVSRSERIATAQALPLAVRAGLEATGLPRAPREGERP
jgi:uncharacterized membrane protein YagU involved in acid resistance